MSCRHRSAFAWLAPSNRIAICAGGLSGALLGAVGSATPPPPVFDPLGCGEFHSPANPGPGPSEFHLHLNVSPSVAHFASFNLTALESMSFLNGTGNPTFRILNRVLPSGGASVIAGELISTQGLVYLVNPNGIFFENGAIVDMGAGAIFAVGGKISNADFNLGTDRFTNLTGTVRVASGASVSAQAIHLIGQFVANHGDITADGTVVTLIAAGSQSEVVLTEGVDGRISVRIDGQELLE
ncbi:MAG: filamentous hemagglutinin N-terminal domain-containing protein, partial [Dehalococcoidia bacterium]